MSLLWSPTFFRHYSVIADPRLLPTGLDHQIEQVDTTTQQLLPLQKKESTKYSSHKISAKFSQLHDPEERRLGFQPVDLIE